MPVELNNKHRCRNRGPLRTDLNQYLFRQPAWRNLEGSEGSSKRDCPRGGAGTVRLGLGLTGMTLLFRTQSRVPQAEIGVQHI